MWQLPVSVLPLVLFLTLIPGQQTADSFAQETLVRAEQRLTTGLYKSLASRQGNLVISPWSVMTMLSVTLILAGGRTASEIGEHMHIPLLRRREILEGFENINMLLGNLTCESSFESVTMVLLDGGEAPVTSGRVLKILRMYLNTYINQIVAVATQNNDSHLVVNPQSSPPTFVNTFVHEQTSGRVGKLSAHDVPSVDRQAALWLLNVFVFQGTWQHAFNPRLTHQGTFRVDGHEEVRLPTMVSREMYPRGEYPEIGISLLELPYGQTRRHALFILLPHRADGLPEVEQHLKPFILESILSAEHTPTLSKVYLPKFRVENDLDLQEAMKRLGFRRMFASGEANFFRLLGKSESLHVSHMVHRALIEVSENGTTAAAATALRIASRQYVDYFRVNHPFLFVLRDKLLGMNLFIGRVTDPR